MLLCLEKLGEKQQFIQNIDSTCHIPHRIYIYIHREIVFVVAHVDIVHTSKKTENSGKTTNVHIVYRTRQPIFRTHIQSHMY